MDITKDVTKPHKVIRVENCNSPQDRELLRQLEGINQPATDKPLSKPKVRVVIIEADDCDGKTLRRLLKWLPI